LFANLLKDEKYDIRISVINGLKKIGGERSFKLVGNMLKDKDAYVRESAITALAEMNGKKSFQLICNMLQDEYPSVRITAIKTLVSINKKKSFHLISNMMQDGASSVRLSAIKALVDIGGGEILNLIEKALKDKDAYVRVEAVKALKDIGGDKAIALLGETLHDKDNGTMQISRGYRVKWKESVWEITLRALIKIGGKKSTALLIKYMDNKDRAVRELVFNYFSNQKSNLVMNALEKHLYSKDLDLQARSIEALTKIGTSDAGKILGHAFDLLNKKEHFNLIIALEKMDAKIGTAALIQGLKGKKLNKESRILILKALGNLKQETSIPTLKEFLKNKDPDLRCYTLQAIGKIGGTEMHSLLDDGLLDDVAAVRESALDAFINYKDKKTKVILQNHLERESEKKLREKTKAILKQIDN